MLGCKGLTFLMHCTHLNLHFNLDSLSPFTLNCETPSMNSKENNKTTSKKQNRSNMININMYSVCT